jgi:hypothetical protein
VRRTLWTAPTPAPWCAQLAASSQGPVPPCPTSSSPSGACWCSPEGSACSQSMRTVPGKAVLFWTEVLDEQPMLTIRASRARSLLQLIHLPRLAQQFMTQSDFLRDHGCHKGTSQPCVVQPAKHIIPTSILSRHVAGELPQTGFMLTKTCVAIVCSRSASEARRELRYVLSSPHARPAMGQMRSLSCAWPLRAGGEPLAHRAVAV